MPDEHAGHRKRMITKMLEGKLTDYEVLEIFLYGGLPRRNTNDLAHRLIVRFGSLPGVFSATIAELKEVDGVGESVAEHIYIGGFLFRKYFQKYQGRFTEPFNLDDFIAKYTDFYRWESFEVLDFYFLDCAGELVKKHRFTDDDFKGVFVVGGELAQLFDEECPAGIVMVHNHPTLDFHPTPADDNATRVCNLACRLYGATLRDHLIFGANGVFSYNRSGRLAEVCDEVAEYAVVKEKEN